MDIFGGQTVSKKWFGRQSPQLSVPHAFDVRNLELKFLTPVAECLLNIELLRDLVLTLAAETAQRSLGRTGCTSTWSGVFIGS